MAVKIAHLKHGGKKPQTPKLIVIHSMGEFIKGLDGSKHAVKFLDKSGLSAQSLIGPNGTNFRCRKDTERAYHAKGYNTNSLGLEVLVEGHHTYGSFLEAIKTSYVSTDQYLTIVEQVMEWIDLWPIKKIVRHSDLSPERKVDPGEGFPWQDLLNDVGMSE